MHTMNLDLELIQVLTLNHRRSSVDQVEVGPLS